MNESFDDEYRTFWNSRYQNPEYAYGKNPNRFLKEQLAQLTPGNILLPADGEGRNGVFAARSGWKVTSLDLSVEAKNKALQLAAECGVSLNYHVGDLEALHYEKESFDVIALIYAHFSAAKKSALHQKLLEWLKPGGTIILEAFSKNHLELVHSNPKVGGPKEAGMLFSTDEIQKDFEHCAITILEEQEIMLEEGLYHIGKGAVIRFVGRKQV